MKMEINNFNMIKHVEIELNGLTVIAGENDTGKSTIGKLLFSIIKAYNMARVKQVKQNRNRPAVEGTLRQVLSLVFERYDAFNSNIVISSQNNELYKISTNQNGWVSIHGSLDSFNLVDATYIESPVVWSLVDFFTTVGKIREQDEIYGISDEIKYPYLLWDLYKKLIIKKTYGVEDESEYINIKKSIKEVIGGDFSKNLESFYFNREQDNSQFPVTTVATGIKSFGIIEMLTQNKHINPKSVVIIDEPEVHLHPKWEVDYAKIICRFVSLGVKVIVTTHSLYMVKALREFSKNYPDKVKFYLTTKTEDQVSQIEDVTNETHKIFKRFADPLQDIVWGKQ